MCVWGVHGLGCTVVAIFVVFTDEVRPQILNARINYFHSQALGITVTVLRVPGLTLTLYSS